MAKFIFKYIKPSFCLFLSIVFFYSNVIAINLAEASLWEERKRAAQKLNKEDTLDEPQIPDQLPSKLTQEDYQLLAQVPQAAHLGFAVPDKITIAPNSIHSSTNFKQSTPKDVETWLSTLVLPFGSIRDIYLSKKEDAPMIIHIQDAHEIIEAQKNMASMIQGLVEERGINLVGLEGAEGAFALDPYRAYPNPKITKGIADYFMKEGYIGGPEFFGITATKAPVLWGVEDINLYQGNIKAYQETIKYKPGIQTFLAELKKGAFQLKEKIYTDELKSFDQHFNAYKNWQEGLGIYVEYLTSVYPKNKERYFNLYLLLEALNWEKKLDFKQVEQERLKLVEVFAKELSEEQLSNLVQQSMLYRLGRMTYAVYYQYLKKVSEQNRISLENLKQLKTYINYVYLADKIDRNQLSVELSNLEETAQSSLATNPEQKRLIALNSNLLLLEKLTSQTMTPEDWLYYKAKDKEIVNIAEETKVLASSIGENLKLNVPENFKEAIQPSKQFCEYAVKRNEAIVENLLKKIKAEKTSKAILIAGGFHSEGLMQIWRQKEISYVVVAPKITEVPKESHYLDVFARDPIPLEKLFAGEIIYLVSWRLTASGANQIAGAAPKIQAFEGILASLQSLMTKAESSPEEWEKKSAQYEKFAEDLKSIDEFEISKEAVSMRDSLYQSLLFRKDGKTEYVVVAAKKENFEMAERENYFGKDGLNKDDIILEKGEITIEGKLYVIRIYAHSNFVGKAGKFTRVSSKRVGASFNKLFQAVDQSIEKVVEISSRFFILFARETKAKSWDEIMDQSPMLTARWLYRAVNGMRKLLNKEAKDIDMDEYSQLHAPYLESGLFGIVYFILITTIPAILYSLGVDSSMVQIYQSLFSPFNVYLVLSAIAGFSHTETYNFRTKEWENASLLKKVELTIRWMVVHGGLLYIGMYAPGYLGGLEGVFGQFGTLDIVRQMFQGMMIAIGIMSGILLHMLHNEKAKIYGWSPLTMPINKIIPSNLSLLRESAIQVQIPSAILNKFIRDYQSSGFAYETAEGLRKVRYTIANHSPEDVNEFFASSAKSIPIKIKVVEDSSGNRYTILYRTYSNGSGDTYLIALPGLVDVNNISVADGSAGEPGRYNYNVYLHTDAGFRAELLFDSGGNLVWGHEKVFQSNQEISTDRLPSSPAFLDILPNARAKLSTPQSARMEPANRYGAPINPQEIIPNLLRSRNITDGMTMVYGDISGLVDNAMGIARSIGLSIGRGQMAELIRNSLGIKWDHGKRPDDTFKVNLQLSNLQPQFPTGRMSLPETRSDKILITGKNKIRGLFKNGHVTQGMELLITDNIGKEISIKLNFVDNILTPRIVYGMETGQKIEIENIVSIKAPSSVFAPQSILLKNPSGEVYGRLVTGAEDIEDLFRDRQLKKGTQLVIEDITGEEMTITFNFLDNIMTPRIVYGMERGQSLQIDRITSVMIPSTLGQGTSKPQAPRAPPLTMAWMVKGGEDVEKAILEKAPFKETVGFAAGYLLLDFGLSALLTAFGIDHSFGKFLMNSLLLAVPVYVLANGIFAVMHGGMSKGTPKWQIWKYQPMVYKYKEGGWIERHPTSAEISEGEGIAGIMKREYKEGGWKLEPAPVSEWVKIAVAGMAIHLPVLIASIANIAVAVLLASVIGTAPQDMQIFFSVGLGAIGLGVLYRSVEAAIDNHKIANRAVVEMRTGIPGSMPVVPAEILESVGGRPTSRVTTGVLDREMSRESTDLAMDLFMNSYLKENSWNTRVIRALVRALNLSPLTMPLLERVKFARVTGTAIGEEIQLIRSGANLVVTLNDGSKRKLSFDYINYSDGAGGTIVGENGDKIKVDKISEMMVERKGRMLNKAQTAIARESQIAFWNLYPKMQSFGFNWIGAHWNDLKALGNMAKGYGEEHHIRNRVFDETLPYLLEHKDMKWIDQYWDDFVDACKLLSPMSGGNGIASLTRFLLESEGYEDTIFYILKNFLNESRIQNYIGDIKITRRYLRRYSAYITAHKSAKYRGRQYSEDKALSLEEFISRSHFEQWSDVVILQTLSHSFFLRYNQLLGTILRLKSKIEEDRGEEFAKRWMKENWDSIFTFYLKNLNNVGWIESYLSRGYVEDIVFLSKLFDRNPSFGIEYIRRTLSLGWDYDQLFHIYSNKHLRDGDINGAAEFFEKFGFYDPFLHHLQKMGFLTIEAEQAILKIMLEIKNDLDSSASTERLVELINKTVEQNDVEVAKIDIRKYIINIFRPDLIKAKSPETESLSVKEAQEKINAVVDLLGEESVEWLQLEKYRGNKLLISEDQIHDYFSQLIVKTVELFPDLEAHEIAEIIRGLIEPEIGKMIPLARFLPLLNKAPGKTSFENKQAEYLEKTFRGKPSAPRAPPLTIWWLFGGARDMNEVITKKAPTIESYGFAAFYLSFTVGFGALFTALGVDPSLSDFIFNSILSAVALYPIFNLIFGFLHGEIEGFNWKQPSTWNLSKYQAKVYQFNKETGNWELQPVGLDMPFRIALAGMVIHLPILVATLVTLLVFGVASVYPSSGALLQDIGIRYVAPALIGVILFMLALPKTIEDHKMVNAAVMLERGLLPSVTWDRRTRFSQKQVLRSMVRTLQLAPLTIPASDYEINRSDKSGFNISVTPPVIIVASLGVLAVVIGLFFKPISTMIAGFDPIGNNLHALLLVAGGIGVFQIIPLLMKIMINQSPAISDKDKKIRDRPTARSIKSEEDDSQRSQIRELAREYLGDALNERIQLIIAADVLQIWQSIIDYYGSDVSAVDFRNFMNLLQNRAYAQLIEEGIISQASLTASDIRTIGERMFLIVNKEFQAGDKQDEQPQSNYLDQIVQRFRDDLASVNNSLNSPQEVDKVVSSFEEAIRNGLRRRQINKSEAARILMTISEEYLKPIGYLLEQSPLGLNDERAFVLYQIKRKAVRETDEGAVTVNYVRQVTRFRDGMLRGNPGWSSFFNDDVVVFSESIEKIDGSKIETVMNGELPFKAIPNARNAQQINTMARLSQKFIQKGFKHMTNHKRIYIQEEGIADHEVEHERRRRKLKLEEGDDVHGGLEEELAELQSMKGQSEPFHILAHLIELAVGEIDFAWSILGRLVDLSPKQKREILNRLEELSEESVGQFKIRVEKAYKSAEKDWVQAYQDQISRDQSPRALPTLIKAKTRKKAISLLTQWGWKVEEGKLGTKLAIGVLAGFFEVLDFFDPRFLWQHENKTWVDWAVRGIGMIAIYVVMWHAPSFAVDLFSQWGSLSVESVGFISVLSVPIANIFAHGLVFNPLMVILGLPTLTKGGVSQEGLEGYGWQLGLLREKGYWLNIFPSGEGNQEVTVLIKAPGDKDMFGNEREGITIARTVDRTDISFTVFIKGLKDDMDNFVDSRVLLGEKNLRTKHEINLENAMKHLRNFSEFLKPTRIGISKNSSILAELTLDEQAFILAAVKFFYYSADESNTALRTLLDILNNDISKVGESERLTPEMLEDFLNIPKDYFLENLGIKRDLNSGLDKVGVLLNKDALDGLKTKNYDEVKTIMGVLLSPEGIKRLKRAAGLESKIFKNRIDISKPMIQRAILVMVALVENEERGIKLFRQLFIDANETMSQLAVSQEMLDLFLNLSKGDIETSLSNLRNKVGSSEDDIKNKEVSMDLRFLEGLLGRSIGGEEPVAHMPLKESYKLVDGPLTDRSSNTEVEDIKHEISEMFKYLSDHVPNYKESYERFNKEERQKLRTIQDIIDYSERQIRQQVRFQGDDPIQSEAKERRWNTFVNILSRHKKTSPPYWSVAESLQEFVEGPSAYVPPAQVLESKIEQRALDRLEQVEKLVIAQNSQMMRDKAAKTRDYSNFRDQVEFIVNDFPEMEPDELAVRINSLPFNSFEAFIRENDFDKLHKAFIIEEWLTRDYPWFRDRLQELKENEPFERYEEYMTKFYDLLLSLGIENPDIEIDELIGEIYSSMGVEGTDSLEGVLRSVRSLFRDERGQSLVEYGIIVPVIIAVIAVVVIVAVNLLNPTGTSIPISNIETLSHAMASMSNIDILPHSLAPTLAQTGTTIITPNITTANMFGNMFMNFEIFKQIMGYLSLVGLVSFIAQMISRKIGRAQLADGARVQSGISIWTIVKSTIIISIIFVVWFMYQQTIGQLLEQTLLPINNILQANVADPLTAVISIGIGLYYRFVELPQQALRAVPVFRPTSLVQPKVIPQGKLAARIKILGELLLGGPAKPISVEQFEISLEGLRNRAVQLQDREKSNAIRGSLREFFRSSVVKSAKNEQKKRVAELESKISSKLIEQEKRVAELETKRSNKLMTGQREVFKEQNTVNELFRMLAEYHASHIPKDQWGDPSLVSQMKLQTQLDLNQTADISQLQLADIELAISIIFGGYYLEDMERKAEVEELLRNAFESYNQRMGELSRLEFANKPLDLEWGKANILEVSANMVTGEKFNGQENSSFDKLRAIAEQIKSDPEKFGKDRPIVITGLGLDIQPSEIEAALEKLANNAGLAAEAIEALKNALKTGKLIFKSATEGNGLVNKAGKINAFALKNSLPKTVQKMDIFALNKDHWDLNGLKEVVKLLVFLAGGLVQKVETGVVEDIKRINLIKFQA